MDYFIRPHARWRMTLRNISEEMIEETLRNPTQKSYDKKGNIVFKKFNKRGGKKWVLIVPVEIVNNKLDMRNNKLKIHYDKASRVLSIEVKKGKVVDSDAQGNVLIDYDKKGDIIRLEFYKFNFDDFKYSLPPLREFSSAVMVK